MTSRNLFFKLIKEDLKRRIWAVCLAFLSFFFFMPVAAAMGLSRINQMAEQWLAQGTTFGNGITTEMQRYARILSLAENVVGMENVMIPLIVGTAAIVLGLTGFSWLHSKKKVDFYHSIPVRRELIFAVKYLDGILIVFSMYLLNLLFAVGIFAMNGFGIGLTFLPGMITMLVHLVNYILMYTVVLIAVVMTGNFFISILGTIVFYSYVPLFTTLLMGLSYMFFETASISDDYWGNIMLHGSPISYYAYLLGQGNDMEMSQYFMILPKLAFPLLVAIALMVFCLLLYRLRPSEAAGKAMAFRLTKAPIKILLVVPFTISISLLFWNIYYSMGWAVFGFLFGLVITHCMMEIIYHFDFKKLFSNAPCIAVCAVLSLAVIGIYRFDVIGYDRYLPAEKRFESASMYFGNLNDWVDCGIPVKDDDGGMSWDYLYDSSYVKSNMKVTDYEAVRAIAEAGIANAIEDKEEKLRTTGDYWYVNEDDGSYWTYVEMGYHLKNGRTVSRRYDVNVTQLRETFDRIYTTAEYKKGTYPVLSYQNDNVTGLYYLKNYKIREVRADEKIRAEILEAYKEELTALTLDERAKETPVAALRFLTIAEREYISQISKQRYPEINGGFRLEDMRRVNFYPVYPSFTKTIALLEKAGIDVSAMPELSDIEQIEILSPSYVFRESSTEAHAEAEYETVSTQYYDSDIGNQVKQIKNDTEENAKLIGEILNSVIDQDMTYMNGLQRYDTSVQVHVFLKSANEDRNSEDREYDVYYFKYGEIPESVKKLIGFDDSIYNNMSYGLNGAED